jgi:hypothetical protein
MTRKKLLWLLSGLSIIVVLALMVVFFFQTGAKQIPSLLGRTLRFDTALIEQTWMGIAAQGDLARFYFRDRVNRFFPVQPVNCRVKYQNVSHQALLAPAGSRIELDIKAAKGDQLSFSLFNLQPGTMTFQVKAASAGKEKLLFSSDLREQMGKVEKVILARTVKQSMRLILETRGSGLGAWIDPCLLQSHSRPRTVLVLMLDTMRADHVSAYGYPRLTTPALDGLAKGSLLFSRAFSPSSWTLPAHVSLFSGRDVLGHGVVSPESVIPADVPLLAEKMQADGFVTLALTGGGFVDDHFGFYRGFQSYANRPEDIYQQKASVLLYRAFMARAADFAGQDLFIFLHTYQMHAPYKAPDPYFRAFNPELDVKIKHVGGNLRLPRDLAIALPPAESADRQKLVDLYDASILYSDQELLKPVLTYLHDSGRFDDTLLVVLSDHGEEFYDHGDWEHGHTLYQELTRIPLIIKLPRQRTGGIRRQLVSISDVAGFILAEYGLNTDAASSLNSGPGDQQRILELALPVIPLRKGLPGRVSYVADGHQYIHNFLPLAPAGDGTPPQTAAVRDEWYTMEDTPVAAVEPFVPAPALHSSYKKMLAGYLRRLRALKKNNRQLDQELLEKLKALGYLNN